MRKESLKGLAGNGVFVKPSALTPSQWLEQLYAMAEDSKRVPSTAIIVAHPDDEIIGVGSRLSLLKHADFVHVTDGAPRSMYDASALGFSTRCEYAEARRQEFEAALALAGIYDGRTREMGFVDQESSLDLIALVHSMVKLFDEIRPSVVLTHPYEGGHPDHDATAFAIHAARAILTRRNMTPPAVIEMASYHSYNGKMTFSEFLPQTHSEITTLVLSKEERDLKRRLLDCFATQRETLRLFPLEIERFRSAPAYNFTQPPHMGLLFYEKFEWGMTGTRWRELATQALAAIGMEDGLWV